METVDALEHGTGKMTDDWREELIDKMALRMERNQHGFRFEVASDSMRACASVALEVAEPVIREECAKIADAAAADYRVYRDHFPHAEGAEQVAAAIREALKP